MVALVGGGIGAWIGGIIGVRTETKKLVKQRAFERRLDWYVRTTRLFGNLHYQAKQLNQAFAKGDLDEIKEIGKRVTETGGRIDACVREALLFATPSTVAILATTTERVDKVLAAGWLGPAGVSIGDDFFSEILKAISTLSADMREHLGLEKLPA
jgi:hypothetical protein